MPSANAFTRLEPSAIGGIVSDVPYLCDGITAVAILVLLGIKGRLVPFNLIVLLAALFYSLSAFIDIGERIRLSGSSSVVTHGEYGIEDGSTTSAIVRDVLLALGHFMQFIFFWILVALPAKGELTSGTRMAKAVGRKPLITSNTVTASLRIPLPSPPNGRVSFFPDASDFHSGSWANLGSIGIVAQWLVLALIVANFVLQLLWRVGSYTGTHQHVSVVELADLLTQLIIVSILMLKLLINTVFLSTLAVRLQALFAVLAVLIAMGISIGLNAVQIAMWKNILQLPIPRLLDALAIWILLVYILAVAFEDVQDSNDQEKCPNCDLPRKKQGSIRSNRSLLRKPRFREQEPMGVDSQASERTAEGVQEPVVEVSTQPEIGTVRSGMALPLWMERSFTSRSASDGGPATSQTGPILPLHNPRPRSLHDDVAQHTFQVHEPWSESDVGTVGRRSLVDSVSVYSAPDAPLPDIMTGRSLSTLGPARPDSGLYPVSSRFAFASPRSTPGKAMSIQRISSNSEFRSPSSSIVRSGRTNSKPSRLARVSGMMSETPSPGTPPIAPPLLDSSVLLDHFPPPPRTPSSSRPVTKSPSSGDIGGRSRASGTQTPQ